MFNCHRCGKAIDPRTVTRRDTCEACDADLHVCLNCRFYSRSASKQCTEPKADFVRDKERANFCDWFQPRRDEETGGEADEKSSARKALDDLFG